MAARIGRVASWQRALDRPRRLLHPHRGVARECGRSAGGQQQLLAFHRRRQDFQHRPLGRRHSRHLDRSDRRRSLRGDARWRHEHHHGSRADFQLASRCPSARCTTWQWTTMSVPHLRQHAGRRHHARPEQYSGGRSERAGPGGAADAGGFGGGRGRRLRMSAPGSTIWAAANPASRFPTSPIPTSYGPPATATR